MTAEIIAIGSELLTPQRVDTNSLFLTDQLNGLGVEVVTKSVIGDDLNRLADAVRRAVSRSEIVILCGGLGPTEDDLTRDAVAAALGGGGGRIAGSVGGPGARRGRSGARRGGRGASTAS